MYLLKESASFVPRICTIPTDILLEAPFVLQVQVGQRSMDMSAHLLPCFRRAECSYDRYLGRAQASCRPRVTPQEGVEVRRRRLVVVDAVQAKAECLHCDARSLSDGCEIL
jgi:hypothetical protein